jgi:hypothetical protein
MTISGLRLKLTRMPYGANGTLIMSMDFRLRWVTES